MPAIVGYARTSTTDQIAGLEAQQRDLKAFGCEPIASEQVSSVQDRQGLNAVLASLQCGDTFVVTKLDRLARSTQQLLTIVADFERRGVYLVVLSMGGEKIDSRSATGKLMLTMFAAVAEFERNILLERQLEGIAKGHRDGKYKGREPTARRQADSVMRQVSAGLSEDEVAAAHGISARSVRRIKKSHKMADFGQLQAGHIASMMGQAEAGQSA